MATAYAHDVIFGDTSTSNEVWRIQLTDLELIAGMLAAGAGITEILNFEKRPRLYYVTSTADVSTFRLVQEVEEADMSTSMDGRLHSGDYGIWVTSAKRFRYNLYRFTTPSFFQGIITVCNHFKVDFRNFIYGQIFDATGNQYALEDYQMTDYQLAMDVPDADDEDGFDPTTDEKISYFDNEEVDTFDVEGFPENNDL